MAIRFRRGTKSEFDSNYSANLLEGEPAWCSDTDQLFIGSGSGGAVEIAKQESVTEVSNALDYIEESGAVRIPLTYYGLNNGFVKSDGTLQTHSGYRVTNMIPVSQGDEFYISTIGSSSTFTVAYYTDINENADTALSIQGTGTNQIFQIIIPSGVVGMRVTCIYDNISYLEASFKYSDIDELKKDISDINSTLHRTSMTFTLSTGFVKSNGTLDTASQNYRYTNLIEVRPGEKYHIKTYASSSTLAVAYYQTSSGNADTTVSIVGTGADQEIDVIIPENISYMRITCTYAQISYLDFCYRYSYDDIISNVSTSLDNIQTQIKNIGKNYTLSKRKGCVSFIFDDGNANDSQIKTLFDSKNKKCGFAIYSADNRYKDYSNEGFEILAHAINQIPASATESDVRTILKTAYATVKNLTGACHGWVTPYSYLPEAFRPLVYDYYEYGYTISKGDVSTPSDACMAVNSLSYELWRTNLESLSIAEIKSIMDYAKANNKMMCIYGHGALMGTSSYWTLNDLEELLDYCNTIELEILPPYECNLDYFSYKHNESLA